VIRISRRIARRVVLFAAVVAWASVPVASGGADGSASSLTFVARLDVSSVLGPCPSDAPPEAEACAQRGGSGTVPGLGRVIQRYAYFVDENASCDGARLLRSAGQLDVAGKGTLRFTLERTDECFASGLVATQRFTIGGGSGVYASASGSGTVTHDMQQTPRGSAGTNTWTGTIAVPGLEFDLVAPRLSGIVNKEVRVRKGVKRVRVRYGAVAQDQVDGTLPAVCRPKSGSWFKVGRTVVKCSATDTSANSVQASFRVLVKPRR